MPGTILLVEDEQALRMTLRDRLRTEGYAVECAGDGVEGLEKAIRNPFDLILLDVMLPYRDGFEVCRELRQAGRATPILMLTARGQTTDKVAGLKIGADDYVTKPFEMSELMARIEVLLRRTPAKVAGDHRLHHFGSIQVDLRGTTVTRDGKPIRLSAREFQLLQYFIEHPGITLSREELLKEVWGYNGATSTRTVDVHVAELRQKLEKTPKKPALILTVQGLGYKFMGREL
jgi:two-component system alkaline phosphatase synthesis response regulator PhoP